MNEFEKEEWMKEEKNAKEENRRFIQTDVKQKPPAGTRMKTQVNNLTYVSTVVPVIKDGRDLHSLQVGGNDNIWKYCKTPVGETVIPISNFIGHLNQMEYITITNDVLCGKLYQWRLNFV
jgi:hypothetical protein